MFPNAQYWEMDAKEWEAEYAERLAWFDANKHRFVSFQRRVTTPCKADWATFTSNKLILPWALKAQKGDKFILSEKCGKRGVVIVISWFECVEN